MCYKPSKHTAHTWYAIGTSDILQWTCHDRIHHVSPGAFCIIVPLLRAHIASKQDSKFPHRTHRTAHQYLLCTLLASIHEPHNKRSHRQNSVPKLPSSATKISCFANDMGSNRALSNNRPLRQQQRRKGANVLAQPGSKLPQYKFQVFEHSLVYRSNLLLLATAVSAAFILSSASKTSIKGYSTRVELQTLEPIPSSLGGSSGGRSSCTCLSSSTGAGERGVVL